MEKDNQDGKTQVGIEEQWRRDMKAWKIREVLAGLRFSARPAILHRKTADEM